MRKRFGFPEVVLIVIATLVIGNFLYITHSLNEETKLLDCIRHERQIIMAIQMYMQDNDKHFPPADRWVSLVTDKFSADVWDCPKTWYTGSEQHPEYLYIAGPGPFFSGVKLGDIPDPSTVPVIVDLKNPRKNKPYLNIGTPNDVAGIISRIATRHNGGATVAFADGHVEWLDRKQAADPKTYQPCIIKKSMAPGETGSP